MGKIEKINKINLISDEMFVALVNRHEYMNDIIREIGMNVRGSAYKQLKKRMSILGINDERFKCNSGNGRRGCRKTVERMFVACSHYNANMKKRIIENKLIPFCCSICGNSGSWQGIKLVLQLDHINGDKYDNRLENFRFLCPNCHSQTDTYAGNRFIKKQKLCEDYSVERKTKILWPSKEFFEKVLWEKPTVLIAKELGVSDKAVEKYIKKLGLTKPPRGYWQKKKMADVEGVEPNL